MCLHAGEFYVNLIQASIIWEEGTSIDKVSPTLTGSSKLGFSDFRVSSFFFFYKYKFNCILFFNLDADGIILVFNLLRKEYVKMKYKSLFLPRSSISKIK